MTGLESDNHGGEEDWINTSSGADPIGKLLFEGDDFFVEEYIKGNEALQEVSIFFEDFIDEFELSDAAFFRNELLMKDFRERFKGFMKYVDNEIEGLKKIIGRNPYSKFSEGWERVVRQACYYIFFVHYGAKRRGETDEEGNLRDYVYHVVRSGFNCLIRKMRFLDEKSLVTAFLHDTREDFHKGFLAVLSADEEALEEFQNGNVEALKSFHDIAMYKKHEVLEYFYGFEEQLEDLTDDKDDPLSVSDLLDILTKNTSDRNKALMEIFIRIFQYKEADKRFSAMRALMIKIADRLDNLKSLVMDKKLEKKEDIRKELIKDETIYIYLAVAKALGMWNVVDWILDYIYFEDSKLRKDWTRMKFESDRRDPDGRKLDKSDTLKSKFKKDFNMSLMLKLGREVVEREDYILEFRPIGLRYEDYDEARKLAENGQYARAFRHYVIFCPIKEDEELYEAGVEVFKRIFSQRLPNKELSRPELYNALGNALLSNRGDVSLAEHGYSDIYGAGVWSAFKSLADSDAVMLGAYHQAYFRYGNKEDIAHAAVRLASLISSIDLDILRLAGNYYCLANFGKNYRNETDVAVSIHSDVMAVFDKLLDLVDTDNEGSDWSKERLGRRRLLERRIKERKKLIDSTEKEDRRFFGEILAKLLMCIFMERSHQIRVYVNEERRGDNDGRNVSYPEGIELGDLLAFIEPLCLGRKVSYSIDGPWPKWMIVRPPGWVHLASSVDFKVDMDSEFDRGRFNEQTEFFERLMDQFKTDLLGEDFIELSGKELRD